MVVQIQARLTQLRALGCCIRADCGPECATGRAAIGPRAAKESVMSVGSRLIVLALLLAAGACTKTDEATPAPQLEGNASC